MKASMEKWTPTFGFFFSEIYFWDLVHFSIDVFFMIIFE